MSCFFFLFLFEQRISSSSANYSPTGQLPYPQTNPSFPVRETPFNDHRLRGKRLQNSSLPCLFHQEATHNIVTPVTTSYTVG
jgi:hypothetical protein